MTDLLSTFWRDAAQAPLVVLTDFDFTISQVDVGDLIVETLSPPSPQNRARFQDKEIGTRLLWLDSMRYVKQAEGERLADTVAIDAGFASFVHWCRAEGIPLAVVSDGFSYYIRRILAREGLNDLPIFCNEMKAAGDLDFPHGNPACDFCGCCKAGLARRVRQGGARVVYIGDGVSDLYGAAFADWVFGKSTLADYLRANGSPFFPLTSFQQVQTTLAENLAAFRTGSFDHCSTLTAHDRCRFE